MLYFDQIDPGKFGTIRVQIWALLHYPFHVAILLTEEGNSKFILWWTQVERDLHTSRLQKTLNLNISNTTGTPIPEVRNESSAPLYEALEAIQPQEAIDLFATVFYSFFIGSGCVLIMLGVLYWCGKGHMTWGGTASVLTRIFAGIGLCLLPVIRTNTGAFRTYILSPWLIPTVVLTFFGGEFFLFGLCIAIDSSYSNRYGQLSRLAYQQKGLAANTGLSTRDGIFRLMGSSQA